MEPLPTVNGESFTVAVAATGLPRVRRTNPVTAVGGRSGPGSGGESGGWPAGELAGDGLSVAAGVRRGTAPPVPAHTDRLRRPFQPALRTFPTPFPNPTIPSLTLRPRALGHDSFFSPFFPTVTLSSSGGLRTPAALFEGLPVFGLGRGANPNRSSDSLLLLPPSVADVDVPRSSPIDPVDTVSDLSRCRRAGGRLRSSSSLAGAAAGGRFPLHPLKIKTIGIIQI